MIKTQYDVVVIGSGPAGVSSAIFCASDGLSVLLIDHDSHLGQASRSSLVENYLGFSDGILGDSLMQSGLKQATRLGSEFIQANVNHLAKGENGFQVWLDMKHYSERIDSKAIILSCGVDARHLMCKGAELPCVHYLPMPTEIEQFSKQPIAIVGGGNAAAQAAIHAAEQGSSVVLIVRGKQLSEMSDYLIERIKIDKAIKVLFSTEIQEISQRDEDVKLILNTCTLYVDAVFCFIGFQPKLTWLENIALNNKGYIITDAVGRTSQVGIYAAGDCTSTSYSRVAAAVGEGAMIAREVYSYLNSSQRPVDVITASLARVADLHHLAFSDVAGKDDSWQVFYAAHIIGLLRRFYPQASFNYVCLEHLLRQVDKLAKEVKATNWQRFYAEFLNEQLLQGSKLCQGYQLGVGTLQPADNYIGGN